jgi:hypothetical protein
MILIPGQVEGISTRKDKTIKITIGTQELTPSAAAELLRLSQSYCYFGIKEEPFRKEETELIDSLKTNIDSLKTPSQRLRAVLYRIYETDNEGYQDFLTYYNAKLEKLIASLKEVLNEKTH